MRFDMRRVKNMCIQTKPKSFLLGLLRPWIHGRIYYAKYCFLISEVGVLLAPGESVRVQEE